MLGAFSPALTGTPEAKDTVRARAYAPGPTIARARELQARQPSCAADYVVAFDVIFAAADSAVPWHYDYIAGPST